MPRFGIPFLVVATLAASIAINTIQFPVVRKMFAPSDAGGGGSSESNTVESSMSDGSSSADFDSTIPEPIAALDPLSDSPEPSLPESSDSTELFARSSFSDSPVASDSPIVAEVADPIASEQDDFTVTADEASDEPSTADETQDDDAPIRCRGSWDSPATQEEKEAEYGEATFGTEDSEDDSPSYAQDEPSCDSFSPSDSALAYDTNPSADLNDSTASGMETVTVEAFAPAEEEQNVYIPPRSAEPQTVAEIDWPAEAAPSGRYARRTTTSVIAHGGPPELIERESTPESAITSAVAVAKPLVPIRRPQAHSQRHDTTSVSVSQERTTHSDDTAALMKIERLPAVK